MNKQYNIVTIRDIVLNDTLSFLTFTVKKVLHGDECFNYLENIKLYMTV